MYLFFWIDGDFRLVEIIDPKLIIALEDGKMICLTIYRPVCKVQTMSSGFNDGTGLFFFFSFLFKINYFD
jgi:hypothetical protein